jgi:hypothetical protein
MGWEVFDRDDTFEGHEVPFVSIVPSRIGFNSAFVRIAALQPNTFVTIHLDTENLKIGFEFHSEKRNNAFLLSRRGGKTSITCSAMGLQQKYAWIRAIAQFSPRNRRFSPVREGKWWVIQLCPAFEERRARESADIPSDARGIYRYVRENGEVVYVGRGDIKTRLLQPERREWDFDRIEYSIVRDPDQQVRWEDYWLTRFKEMNRGKLPIYNKISGSSMEPESETSNG